METMTREIQETIENRIFTIRGKKVILDEDLAVLYGVETRVLNQTVKRNSGKFPDDFMFELTEEEMNSLRSQNVTLEKWGTLGKYHTMAFSELGVSMLSFVLKSKTATEMSIRIVDDLVGMPSFLKDSPHMSPNIGFTVWDMLNKLK